MSNLITCPNAALEGRYRAEPEVGEGGMATFLLANALRQERIANLRHPIMLKRLGVTFFSLLILLPGCGQPGQDLSVSEPGQLGRQIVFESERDGHTEIYVMDADGSNQRRLTYTVGEDSRSSLPHWSPNRRRIAFSSGPNRHMEIYIMDGDGSNVGHVWNAEGTQSEAWGPQWSPDGSRFVFVSNQGGNYDIHVMDADGLNERRLTVTEGSGKYSEDPVWSPDGEWIVFNSNRDGISELYVMRPDGSELR